MTETELLRKISDDLDFLNKKILEIEESLELIDSELHPVREEYLKRLDKINEEGTVSGNKFEKKFRVKLWDIRTNSAGTLKEILEKIQKKDKERFEILLSKKDY